MIETPRFSDSLMSFMAYSPLPVSIRRTTLISISIKPETHTGLLIYTDHNIARASGDFLAIGLYDGFVELRYNLGSGTAEIRSRERVTLNEWHTIVAARTERSGTHSNVGVLLASTNRLNGLLTLGTLVLDDQTPVTGSSLGTASLLNIASELFIGGLEHYSQVVIQ